jgi:glycine/D-amino acid oxidase-like deaminating enzyme
VDVVGGAYCNTDGYAGPNEVTHAIAKGARRYGVQILERAEVISIEVLKDRIVSVTTRDERVETRTVVNAAGPYATKVGKLAGVEIKSIQFVVSSL